MAKQYTRDEVLKRFKATIAEGRPVVIAGAGTGISGKFAERGGADLVGVYNSGLYRMDGNGSLAGLMRYRPELYKMCIRDRSLGFVNVPTMQRRLFS